MVKPTKKQLEFLSWEMGVFFHFGIRTFNEGHTDWDGKEMHIDTFNPTELDCENWMQTVKESGAKYAILTTKHHDGFALWPSKYTDYSVKNTTWRDGKGDVVKEFTDACRKYDIKVGLYYSPAQQGIDNMTDEEYDDYFIGQLSELLENYGKIDYMWFDGCGSEKHNYNKDRIIARINELQPDLFTFSMFNTAIQWAGNEEGMTPFGKKNVVRTAATSVNGGMDEYDEGKFMPYECDCRIRRFNWFYSDQDAHLLRSVDDLMGLYDYSVGRGGNLLVNIAPDRRGKLPEKDSEVFIEFGKKVKEQFEKPVDIKINQEGDIFEVIVKNPTNIKTIVLEEDLTDGEKIHKFELGVSHTKYCKIDEYIKLFQGEEIGNKRIIRIPSIYVGGWYTFKIVITDKEEGYKLKSIKFYEI